MGSVRLLVLAYLFLSALLLALAFVPVARQLAFRFNVLDQPGERKIHSDAKPYLGGVAIYFAFVGVIAANLAGLLFFGVPEPFGFLQRQIELLANVWPKLAAIIGGGTMLVILGVVDDVKGVEFSPRWKLLVQFGAAILAVSAGVKVTFLPWDWLDALVSVMWIVVLTNSFNLLDNMDGLSAGVAVISAAILLGVAFFQGQVFVAMILAVFIGSVLGFLKYNYHPSSIFMGDAGSLFIGYIMSTLTISTSYVTGASSSLIPAMMPLVILSIPIFDTISVVIIRLREHRPIYVGDKRHLSHRLVDMGFSRRSAVNLIYLLSITLGLAAFLLPGQSVNNSLIIISQALIIIAVVSILMFVGRRTSQRQE